MNNPLENTAPKITYPTAEDVERLRVIAETKAIGTNVHKLLTCVAIMGSQVEEARMEGWNEDILKIYNEEKLKLNKLLLSIK